MGVGVRSMHHTAAGGLFQGSITVLRRVELSRVCSMPASSGELQ